MEPTTQIAAYNTRLEADLVVAKLAEAGIDAFVVADNLGGTFPMMQMVTGGYRVMVPETLAEEAAEIAMADEDQEPPERRRPALARVLAGLTPTQAIGAMGLMAASLVAILYAITRGTL